MCTQGHLAIPRPSVDGCRCLTAPAPRADSDGHADLAGVNHHVNFRDPDGIALELQAPTAEYAAVLADVATREPSDEEVTAIATRLVGAETPSA